ncbi:uncharacterized protein PV07_04153 [Cladophialophora immunda]|uniref:Xylanolytic transcriptional activator regulatory domain-containing protein n=1 Tax=Cladophialophora immunda TaxID=569365 RepID=A0A0D2B4Y9_9EURO|nr:uncharacterized protein PV07_04153 [Cladophialophora immunda]KIW32622.1 hypothetical protein PV07_04153 [Cladophialophora immunda]
MSPAAADLIQEKGALSLPSACLRNALWQAYLRSVHPFLPLLDVETAATIMQHGDRSKGQYSLLLFHAIMLAGTHSVDMEYLRSAGYTSKKACLHNTFEIVKLLYDLDYEQDRICLIQSLLLMTLWYRSPDDHKDPWHYVGLAVSLARKTGLHRESTIAAAAPNQRPLLRRLWWCCVLRDYMIGYGMSRPVHIHLDKCTVSMLTMDDFVSHPLISRPPLVVASAELNNYEQKGRHLAVIFLQLVKLCKIGHDHLELQDTQGLDDGGGRHHDIANLRSDHTEGSTEDRIVQKADAELATWFAELPDEAAPKLPSPGGFGLEDDVLVQHHCLLHMLYHTAVITVHRKHLVPPDGSVSEADLAAAAAARAKVRTSAREITGTCEMLKAQGLMNELPMPFMPCILVTTIVHLLEIKFAGDRPDPFNVKSLALFTRILREVGSNVSYMEWSFAFIQSACQTAKIPMSMTKGNADQPDVASVGNALESRQPALRPNITNPVVPGDLGPISTLTPSPEAEVTYPPVSSPAPPQEDDLGFGIGLPSPFDDNSFEVDYSFLQNPADPSWSLAFDTAGRDLPTGYGEILNTCLTESSNFRQTDHPDPIALDPFLPDLPNNGFKSRVPNESGWPHDAAAMDYNEGMCFEDVELYMLSRDC